MIFYMIVVPYLCYFGLYDIYYNNFDKLDNLGCSELQKSLVKWMINNFFVMLFFLHKFQPRRVFTNRNMLRQGSLGVALTSVWIPVVKDSAHFLIPLMLIHAFCLVIGPLHTHYQFIRRILNRNQMYISLIQAYILFFNMYGRGAALHFLEKPFPVEIDCLDYYTAYLMYPRTPFEFVKIESYLAVILLAVTMVLPDFLDRI
ncbi:hypothetical protein GCK72_003405 [Caenorhabditis remanei]|uniref:Uncharacterized protein n=1 Tax=Caenorhabditis remanei TaxID=31234 RepID=A0A6A5HUD9_CAERE|nr:hypothetical protein GCK72_003405 [Caenorhabditis remanei]KAF1771578.1 hypothetical protein GCK72_003405 [Caenorhabditis remanei]